MTKRERLILSYLIRGASNKHIAKELGISDSTVKVHVKNILRKIRVENRTQAAWWALGNEREGNVESRSSLVRFRRYPKQKSRPGALIYV
ncbi:MAG: winged helix-turn-helix transcriptional regulator [Alphaproteobacteria bacterium]|nr:winged helix-turn-helix transcriptional regulator [Alphaproteobacteria bacterium]